MCWPRPGSDPENRNEQGVHARVCIQGVQTGCLLSSSVPMCQSSFRQPELPYLSVSRYSDVTSLERVSNRGSVRSLDLACCGEMSHFSIALKPACLIVDGTFDRCLDFGRHPWCVADDEISFAFGKKACLNQADLYLHVQALNILSGTL